MKKYIAFLLAAVMLLGLCACSSKTASTSSAAASTSAAASASTSAAASASTSAAASAATSSASGTDAKSLVSESFIDPVTQWSQYNDLIAQIKSSTDYAKRTELMHQAQDILMSNFCILPIYYYNDIYLQKDYVDGIYSNLFGFKFFQYATMSNKSDTLRINLASEPGFLDPALNSSVDGACLAVNSFAGLYTYDADGKTVPDCADSYTVSADGLTYTVKLKSGLKWSDGSDLTAKDFEYSWKRAASKETAADYAYMFNGFDGFDADNLNVKATDDTTLQFVLTAPCAYIEDLMAFPAFYPVKQSEVEKYDDWKTAPGHWCQDAGFVSNGAYVCTKWEHDTSMTYEKNPYYHNADKVTINKLQFMLSADDTAIYAAYKAGDIDFADTVPTDEVANLLKNPEFHIVDNLGTYYAAFNCKSKLFDGKTPEQAACMREAFTLLVDRDYIVTNIGQTGQVAANSFIPLGMSDGNGGVFKKDKDDGYFPVNGINDDYDGTVQKARDLLTAAGYKFDDQGMLSADTPINVEYLTNNGTGHVAVAEAMQQDFSAIGITMKISSMDWNVFLEERKKGNFDFCREGWLADFNDPINMLEMWTTDSGNNDCQFGR
jgi:oligopeptide transport system substrate-binding protein